MRHLVLSLIFASWCHSQTVQSRTVTSSGNFFEWDTLVNGFYKLKWGNKKLVRTYPEQFDPQEAFAGFISDNDQVIILEGSCGRSCLYALILPLDSTSAPIRYSNPLDFDIKRNLIAYSSDQGPSVSLAVAVQDFMTGETQFFVADDCHNAVSDFGSITITLAQFQGARLHYEWQCFQMIPGWPQGKPISMSRTVLLEFRKR